jgi:redox-sensitive bicupin YhaK (pirin superfamily)
MIAIKRSQERGHADHGWLNTYHSFSFANYYDPRNMGYRSLRVINEDVVQPGQGFGTHGHNDMEILTWILDGSLEHRDSMGSQGVIRPGELQRMSAGTGVRHSEFNHSKTDPVHLLQIWILPERRGIEPSYEQTAFSPAEREGKLKLIAARKPQNGAVKINQDAAVYTALLAPGEEVSHQLANGRGAYLQVARGSVALNGNDLSQGDGAVVEQEALSVKNKGTEHAEVLLFDLA